MQEQPFRAWLRDVREQVEGSIATRLADCSLVERHEGDLDAHWNADGLRGLLDRLTYSREDERNGRSPGHNVPTKGDLYNNSATFKAAVNLYRKFLDARGDEGAEGSVAHCERWDRYLEEVRRYVESGKLDREEIDYKSRIAAKLTSARNAVLAGDEDWSDLLKEAILDPSNNLIDFRFGKPRLRDWLETQAEEAFGALAGLWSGEDISLEDRIRSFTESFPTDVLSGTGTRLRVISVLLMALDAHLYPPYKFKEYHSAFARTGHPVPPAVNDEASQYEHALVFLDKIIERARLAGLKRPKDRLEAQSVLFAVAGGRGAAPKPADDRPCWFVGASWDAGDQTDRFIREGIWQNGYEEKYLDYVKSIEPGDRIAIKATFVKKHGLPFDNRSEDTSTMAIKATGVVTENMGDGRNLRVDWTPAKPSREWYFYTYQPTVWKVTRDSGWQAAALIDFTFDGAEQDHKEFLRHRFPERYADDDPNNDRTDSDVVRSPAEVDVSDLAIELLYEPGVLQNITNLLDDKRQVIFQGPPGTGKTYAARELATFLAGSNGQVTLVQFHPSYAYEDFVQGYRPTLTAGQAGFELRDGPLVAAAAAARTEPDALHFLIIDEINRGNLAKVFGELYFLLEYRDEDMRLQYASTEDEPFSLPENLYIIGTMNTADRSIALVDLALRRRFHFVEFHPDKEPVEGLLGRWLERNAPEMAWVADVMRRANSKLDDRQAAIGPSYFMKEDLNEEKVRLIWEHNVLPYVEEHLYGEPDRLADFDLGKLRRATESAASAAASDSREAPGEPDGDGQDEEAADAGS